MHRPWKRTPRCARSAGVTPARRTARFSRAWPKRAASRSRVQRRLKQFDRTRQGKRIPNTEWTSPTDPDARITRIKDGCTGLAYKPEQAVDLDTAAIIAAEIQPADQGDKALRAWLVGLNEV
jgi:hypothetical protein